MSIFEIRHSKTMKSRKEILGFDDTWLMIIGIPTVSFVMNTFIIYGTEEELGFFFYFLPNCLLVSLSYTLIYWFSFREVFIYFKKKYPRHSQTIKRITYQTTTLLVFYFVVKLLINFFVEKKIDDFLGGFYRPHDLSIIIGSLAISFLIVAIYEGIFFYNQLNISLLEKEQLERENIISQLEGLKNQVNPHFLFNSLNTLSYIIPENADKAVRFVQQLSKVYRYILEIRNEKLISLREEFSFLEAYVFLLKERFGDNLQVNIEIEEIHMNLQIVPLSLQILFENAIKHNIISTERPLAIEVFVEKGNKLIVKNNLQKKNQVMNSTKLGLQNIKNRYQFLSDKQLEIIVTTGAFIVSLPLLDSKDVILDVEN